jgi:Protein of unknown function (DUF2510)
VIVGWGQVLTAPPIRPARFWFAVAAAAMAGSVVLFVVGLVLGLQSISRQVDRLQRVPAPGEGVVSFAEPGGYVLYFEGLWTGADTGSYVPPPTLSLVPVGGEGPVPIRSYAGTMTYEIGGHSGRAIGTIQIDQPGSYRLQVQGESLGSGGAVAVGRGIGRRIVVTLGLTFLGPGVLFLAGMVLAIVVSIRRSRNSRPLVYATGPPVALPGGWHADPTGRYELRYWDGRQWTAHVATGGNPTVDPR